MTQISDSTRALSEFIASSATRGLPADVEAKTILHIVDTVAAIVSGSAMAPGKHGARFARRLAPTGSASILGTSEISDVITAALANGMSAHADETDDSHEESLSHPGCAVVPAALAVGESLAVSGSRLIRAVAVGYDSGTRVGMTIGFPARPLEGSSHSSHAHAGVYGAAAAAASLYGFDAEQSRFVLSYAAQSASGTTSWARDPHHIEKAFVFGGMPASNGVRAAELVSVGCDGVADAFDGQPNVLNVFTADPDRSKLSDALGDRYEIMRTNIKKFAVGSPSQAPVQAVLDILSVHDFSIDDIESLQIEMPHDLAQVVDDRAMPNINVQYLVAGTLIDGRFSFAMAHDFDRLVDPAVRSLRSRTQLVHDPSVTGKRQASVRLVLADGRRLERFVPAVRGTVDNPMSSDEVEEKARDLIAPVLGNARCEELISTLMNLERLPDITTLARLCRSAPSSS